MKHVIKICGQNVEFLYAKSGGTYSNHINVKEQHGKGKVVPELNQFGSTP
jgi:hypothetical protein